MVSPSLILRSRLHAPVVLVRRRRRSLHERRYRRVGGERDQLFELFLLRGGELGQHPVCSFPLLGRRESRCCGGCARTSGPGCRGRRGGAPVTSWRPCPQRAPSPRRQPEQRVHPERQEHPGPEPRRLLPREQQHPPRPEQQRRRPAWAPPPPSPER